MDTTKADDITGLLRCWKAGDATAREALVPLVYDELRRCARYMLRGERGGHTLQATALAHEAYVRLLGKDGPRWKGRAHFFAVAAQLMRRILVDYARTRSYAKRGGGRPLLSLDETAVASPETDAELIALDDALDDLDRFDPRLRELVELRFFGGLTIFETAEVLCCSPATVKRDWRVARTWLYAALNNQDP